MLLDYCQTLPERFRSLKPSPVERGAADCLYSIENRRSGAVAQNGLGGGLGAGLTELSNQRAPIFRIRRPRPAAVGPQPTKPKIMK